MMMLKRIGAAAAAVTILALSPHSALAGACNQCFGGCIDAYGTDNSESGLHALSQCFNACTDEQGFPCMIDV